MSDHLGKPAGPFGSHTEVRIIRPAREAWIKLFAMSFFCSGVRQMEKPGAGIQAQADPGRTESLLYSSERPEPALVSE